MSVQASAGTIVRMKGHNFLDRGWGGVGWWGRIYNIDIICRALICFQGYFSGGYAFTSNQYGICEIFEGLEKIGRCSPEKLRRLSNRHCSGCV